MSDRQNEPSKPLPAIAIIGADGCGKSAVIESLAECFSHERVKEKFILTRSKSKEVPHEEAIQNYEKQPRSTPVSIIKISIKAILWSVRYWAKIAPLSRKGTLVLYDHFYFLILALDPRKHRYSGPISFLWKIAQLVPQPNFYILLDADVDVLYQRKKEASRTEVQELIERHRCFMSMEKVSGTIVDASRPLDEVVSEVSKVISRIIESTQPFKQRDESIH